jgi:hypothetical protein
MKNNTYNFEKKQSVFGLLKMIISIYKVFDAGMIIISFALSVLFNIFLNNQYFKKSETWTNTLKYERLFTNIIYSFIFVVSFFIILFALSWIVRGITYGCAKIKSFLKMRYLPLSIGEIKETLGEKSKYYDYINFINDFLKVKLFYFDSSVISAFTFINGWDEKYCIIKIPSELFDQIAESAVKYYNCTKDEFIHKYMDFDSFKYKKVKYEMIDDSKDLYIGKMSFAKNGEIITIIEYNSCNDIKVQFKDGTIVSTTYYKFITGDIDK